MTRRRRWFLRVLAAVLFLVAASECLSLSLRTRRAHRFLTARLEAAFGRPVEVGHFACSLFDGPRIEAAPITVAEDPRFGAEYFVRSERMTAGLRWGRLLLGHFEFGTLSFTRPSLNLVRAADGRWNIENWLPPSSELPQKSFPGHGGTPARLYEIAVDGGRINLVRGVDKQPFALVDVRGTVEQEIPGRWRLDLAAQPMRAGAALQEAGTIRVRGSIAGTTARLQPADLYLTWENASLADVFRLARGKDYGVRGRLALELTARSQRPSGLGWSFSLSARGSQFHRWDMTELPADPALNLKAEARWTPGEARMELSSLLIEAPHSQIHGTAKVVWPAEIRPDVDLRSAEISFADLLDWLRAFRPGVAEGLAVNGTIHGKFTAKDWPLQLEHAELSSSGATIRVPSLVGPIRVGEIFAELRRGVFESNTVLVQLPSGTKSDEVKPTPIVQQKKTTKKGKTNRPLTMDQLALAASLSLRGKSAQAALDGAASRAEDLLTVATAFGRPANPRWKLEGSAELHIRWQLGFLPWTATMAGSTDLRGTRLWMTGLNFPVEISGAHMEWGDSDRRVAVTGAKAVGAQWQGNLEQQMLGPGDTFGAWEFRLSADRITATNLDRWLGPRSRPSFFDRLFPSAPSPGTTPQSETSGESPLKNLQASGQIAIDDLAVEPLRLHKLKASVELENRALRLYDVQSEFYAGKLSGVFEAKLGPQPEYRVDANFDRANLGILTAATARLKDHLAGIASGEIHLTARGIGRENLVKSLEGRGALMVHNALFRGLDVNAALAQGVFHPGATQWPSAEAAFTIGAGKVEVRQLRLDDRSNPLQVDGTVQFSHTWDLRIRSLSPAKEKRIATRDARAARLIGSLEMPQVVPLEAPPGAH